MDRNLVAARRANGIGEARYWLLSTSAAALVFAAAPALAQDDQDTAVPDSAQTQIEEPDEIVVTGIRAALQAARDLKRNADTAVDSITASDVSALPDLSVSEALARVPGVVVQRVQLGNAGANPGGNNGDFPSPEGGGNLVRGLTLVRSEFNGRDAFSANGGRALDFGTVPPELIGAVDVFKNTSADLIEGGIGGTINLRTLEPFDRNNSFGVLTADGTYTDLRDEVSPELSALLSHRWDTAAGEFGLLGSISYSELKSDLNGFQVGPLTPVIVNPTFDDEGNAVLDENGIQQGDRFIAVPGGFQLRTNEVDRERDSIYLAGQWQNPDRTLKLTGKYVNIDNVVDSSERTLEWFADGENFSEDGAPPGVVDLDPTDRNRFDTITGFSGRGTALVGDFTTTPLQTRISACNGNNDRNPALALCEQTFPVDGLYETGVITNNNRDWLNADGAEFQTLAIRQFERSETEDISLNAKWRPSDQLFVNLDAHRTTGTSNLQRVWGGTRFFSNFSVVPDLDNPQVTLVPTDNNTPLIDTGNGTTTAGWNGNGTPLSAEFNDPRNNFLLYFADEFNDNEGELWAVRGDVEYEFDNDGWFDAVKFGARFSDREQTNRQSGLNWAAVAAPWEGGSEGYVPLSAIDNQNIYEEVDFSDFFGRDGVIQGDNQSFLFVGTDFLGNYDQIVQTLATESLITQIDGADDPNDSVPDGEIAFADFRPLNQNNSIDFTRNGTIDFIDEETLNLYGRLDFGQEFDNGMSIDANVGLRYTETTVTGVGARNFTNIIDNDDVVADFAPEALAFFQQDDIDRSGLTSQDDRWLPSLNVKFNLNDENLIRFGYSKNITRPRIEQIRLGQSTGASIDQRFDINEANPADSTAIDAELTAINVSGGNFNLQPITADNYDLSFERYWGDENSLTVSLFRKDIRNNIIFGTRLLGTEIVDGEEVPVLFNGDLNQDEATLNGVELAYTQFYDFLPGLLSNLGLQANYTYIDADTNVPLPIVDANGDGAPDSFERIFRYGVSNFPGLSEHTYNIVGIYQSDVVELRLAYNWRSDYLSSYRDFVTGNPIFQEDRGFLDGSVKYDINDNLQLRAQVANILNTKNQATQQFNDAGDRFGRTSFVTDRRVKVGLRYQF